jgi:hypothetical protein
MHRTRPCPHLAGSHPITSHTPLPIPLLCSCAMPYTSALLSLHSRLPAQLLAPTRTATQFDGRGPFQTRASAPRDSVQLPNSCQRPEFMPQARQLPSRPSVQLPAPTRGSCRHPTAAPVRLRGLGVPQCSYLRNMRRFSPEIRHNRRRFWGFGRGNLRCHGLWHPHFYAFRGFGGLAPQEKVWSVESFWPNWGAIYAAKPRPLSKIRALT